MRSMPKVQKQRVHPLRGDDFALPSAADEGLRRIQATWAEIGAYYQRGIEHAKSPHRERMQTIATELATTPGPARDPETEATLLAMLDYWSRRGFTEYPGHGNERYAPVDEWFVRRWLAAGGVPFALRALEAFPRIDFAVITAKQHTLSIQDRDGYKWWCLEVGHLGVFHVLRRFVVAASDDEYRAGVAEAVRIREHAPLWLRAAIAFAFPDEPFYDTDLAAMAGKKLPVESWGLVTTRLADHAKLAAILDSMRGDSQSWTTETELYGHSLVHRLGDDSAPLLVGFLDAVRGKTAKQAFAEALALCDSPIAVEFFQRKHSSKELRALAKAYLAGGPDAPVATSGAGKPRPNRPAAK
jgi:hypothetical protein